MIDLDLNLKPCPAPGLPLGTSGHGSRRGGTQGTALPGPPALPPSSPPSLPSFFPSPSFNPLPGCQAD